MDIWRLIVTDSKAQFLKAPFIAGMARGCMLVCASLQLEVENEIGGNRLGK
jgi:hypothetical protein